MQTTVAGAIGVYDLPDLAASLAPKKLLLAGVTDGNGNSNNTTDIEKDLGVIKAAYSGRLQQQLQILPATSFEQLTSQLKSWLEK
jgi:hypothetical protein